MSFQQQLLESLVSNGQRVAIERGEEQLSYSTVLRKADRITRQLLDRHLEGSTIGIMLSDRVQLICAIIGVINARCVFVPLDGSWPDQRFAAIAADLQFDHIVLSRSSAERTFPDTISSMLYWEDIQDATAEGHQTVGYPSGDPDDSIYVYFTSGSTGTPKGIIGRNGSLLQFMQWEIREFGIGPASRVSQLISPYFDAFLRDIFVPLLVGGTICIPPAEDDFFTPEKIVAWTDASRITLIHCVPSQFRVMLAGRPTPGHFTHLDHILLSGEKLNPAELTAWYATFGPRIQLVNLYGATETTLIRCFYRIQPEDIRQVRIPIGAPIDGTEFRILDESMRPCDDMVPGELFILSDHMSKGYLNLPEMTYAKFVILDRGTPGEIRAFRTGDIARRLPDGMIDLLGREDRQIKIRGIRIEPEEIEQTALRCGWVRNILITPHAEGVNNEMLVAFLTVSEEGKSRDDLSGAVTRYLADRLPAYMVPTVILVLDEFPMLGNGKIDHKRLLQALNTEKVVEPATITERRILSIWKEILGEKPISTDSSFIRIGGNSLNTMRLIGRIYKEFNVRVSLGDLFDNLTIQKQALLVEKSIMDPIMVIPKAEIKSEYRLSAAQERIWYEYQRNTESTAFNMPALWKIQGKPDKKKIENNIRSLIDRHESLRTRFEVRNGSVVQVVEESVDFSLETPEGEDVDVQTAMLQFVRPFDPGKAPLIRCALIPGEGDCWWLAVDLHHIICDGMSQRILGAEFLGLGDDRAFPRLSIQYKDYAEWEATFRTTSEYHASRYFWMESLAGDLPRITLPTVTNPGAGSKGTGGFVLTRVDGRDIKPLIEHLRDEEITVFSGLFAVYFLFLSQLSGQDDLVVGTAASGRLQYELEGVVGMFAKMLPVRYRLTLGQTFRTFLKGLHQHVVQANSKQLYDLGDIISDLNKAGSVTGGDLFHVAFVFHDFRIGELSRLSAEYSGVAWETRHSKYPIMLHVATLEDGSLDCWFEYLDDYFERADVEMLAEQFRNLAIKISMNPEARLEEIISDSRSSHPVPEEILFSFDLNP